MEQPEAYIPIDRRHALARGEDLPERAEGAALFADISGFTPLTAALLKELGLKRGAEELPHQLNLVYDALINEVHRYGGSVISFSGDAITCWLDGDDGSQATACAVALQAAMRQFESITTPAGTTISLGLKVAVVTGSVRRFQVGDPDIQLMDALAGTTLERMAAAEQQAERGDIIVTPEVVEKIGAKLTIAEYRTDLDTGIQFAKVAGLTEAVTPNAWPSLPAELSDAQVRPWLLPPVYDWLQSGGGEFLAEIRPSVALFLRFGGIDYDTDPQAGVKLDAYIRWVQGILAQYESYMLQLTIGDKGCYLYASFGSPQLHDDDPARAVAAALDMQKLPNHLAYIGSVQIGISQGRMRCGAYGGLARRTYGSLGDEVNMAARLMSHAAPGQILVSQRIADAVAELYDLENLGRIKIKSKDEPIPVTLVVGQQQAHPRTVNLFPTPLVGRKTELARMEQLLATAEAGQTGQILRINGVAGIGKSHLTATLAQQATRLGWRVVLGSCHSINQNIPYHPWQQIFRALFALVGGNPEINIEYVRQNVAALNPDWLVRLPLLGDLLDLPIPDNPTTAAFEPRLRQEALFTFALDLIHSWAQVQPLLLLLEDAHWLDEASQGLTVALARVTSRSPLLLAVIQRPPLDEDHPPILSELDHQSNYNLIDLSELNPAGVAAVIANRIAGQPAPLLVDLIVVQARGNPFFVEEMTDTLREAGHLIQQTDGLWTLTDTLLDALRRANCITYNQAGQMTLNLDVPLSGANLGLPDSIQQVVLSRMDRLLEEQRLTLKVASVIGRVFGFRLLFQAHPLEADEERLLRQLEIIEAREFARLETPLPNLTHLFKHNITRDVAYNTLLESQQRDLHRAVAEAMEEFFPEAVEPLAYHYTRARVRDKALLYLDRSAQKAQREYANETALAFYEQALALEERWQWRKGQIEVLHLLGRRKEEQAALVRLEAIPDTPPFEVAYLWGQYYEAIADYPQAQAAVARALEAARAAQDRLGEIRCLGQLGLIARRQGDYDGGRAWYEAALADFDERQAHSTEEAHAFAQVLTGLGIVHRQQGAFDASKGYYQQSLVLSRKSENRRDEAETLNSLGVMAYYQRNLSDAHAFYRQTMELRNNIGDRAGQGISFYNLALTTQEMGDYGHALVYFLEALAIQQAIGNRWEEVNVWNGLGILYHELGKLTQAKECLDRGLQIARGIGDEEGEAYLLSNFGIVVRDQNDLPQAESLLLKGLTIMQKLNNKYQQSFFLSYLSTVSLQMGNFEKALEWCRTALNLRQELGLRLRMADDLATLSATHLAMGDLNEASTNAEQTLAILEESKGEGPEFPQRDYFICYQVLAAHGQEERAQVALHWAYKLVNMKAEKIADTTLRQSFLEQVAINREIVETYENSRARSDGT